MCSSPKLVQSAEGVLESCSAFKRFFQVNTLI